MPTGENRREGEKERIRKLKAQGAKIKSKHHLTTLWVLGGELRMNRRRNRGLGPVEGNKRILE